MCVCMFVSFINNPCRFDLCLHRLKLNKLDTKTIDMYATFVFTSLSVGIDIETHKHTSENEQFMEMGEKRERKLQF